MEELSVERKALKKADLMVSLLVEKKDSVKVVLSDFYWALKKVDMTVRRWVESLVLLWVDQ